MPFFRDGSLNISGLQNPGVYIDNILPTPFIQGVTTNIEGLVGVGSWGPVNSQQRFSTTDGCAAVYGTPLVRSYDIATYVQTAVKQGPSVGFCAIRVTDGTDTAAVSGLAGACGSMAAKYTGTRGNQITYAFQTTTVPGAYAAIISFPGRTPERFDNIKQSIAQIQVSPGTGFTSVPMLLLGGVAASGFGAVQATVQASLAAVSAAVSGAGTGHAVNDILTLGAGVTVKVTAVGTNGVITNASLINPGLIAAGTVPSTAGQQVATTGSGTGASFTLVWGLGAASFTPGYGYSAAPTIQVIGGGGTGGSYTPVTSFWAALAYAIANGTPQRGASQYIVFAAGAGTATPTLNSPVYLAGGTDGAAGVGTPQMIGVDIRPRTGMYALRSSGCNDFALCDLTDPTTWATQIAFGNSEAMLPITATAQGDTIAGAVATRANEGVDDPWLWIIEGDWPTVYDDANGINRMVSPQAIAVALLGNLSPEQSPINKPLIPVIATQSSTEGVTIDDSDESQAQTGGIDLIGRSDDLGAIYFSFLTGRNASSNTAANGVEYTRLTNFLERSLNSVATRSIVGKLQSSKPDDPTRNEARAILNTFMGTLADPQVGSGGYGLIDGSQVVCDTTNNPQDLQNQGFLFAYVKAEYLNTVRYFVIKLAGGSNVSVTSQPTQPTASQLYSLAA